MEIDYFFIMTAGVATWADYATHVCNSAAPGAAVVRLAGVVLEALCTRLALCLTLHSTRTASPPVSFVVRRCVFWSMDTACYDSWRSLRPSLIQALCAMNIRELQFSHSTIRSLLMRKHVHRFLVYAFIVLGVSACTGVPIRYYDATTYTQLTSLKAETSILVESFDTKPYVENEAKIEATTLNLRKAYEYEKGKGEPNSDTTKQLSKIADLFMEDVKDYKDSGPGTLGAKYFQEASVVLGQAFDIAISTENLKNKDKR
jgi:hypothetical protein